MDVQHYIANLEQMFLGIFKTLSNILGGTFCKNS